MNKRVIAVVVAAVAAVGVAVPVWAFAASSGPSVTPLTIEGETTFGSAGTFEVTAGGLCPSGEVVDEAEVKEEPFGLRFIVHKTFTCADASGTFFMDLEATAFGCDSFTFGTWEIGGGTGSHTEAHAEGHVVGMYDTDACTAASISDHFRGELTSG